MIIKLVNRETEAELLLEGRMDAQTSVEAETVFLDMAERFDKLILNMEKLDYISSSGLRALKRTHMAMVKKSGVLELKNVNKMVMEVFEMTGFVSLLRFV
ncbi:MAG: STAS domain-containing protein [Bacillota bacterium]|nr:STAS domain-containing protein [Bacillota bacterium]